MHIARLARRASRATALMVCAALAACPPALAARAGALDPSFNGKGFELQDFLGTQDLDRASAVARQPNGKLVVAGETETGGTGFRALVARFNPDGSLDRSFGTPPGGFLRADVCANNKCGNGSAADSIALDGSKIVVAGVTNNGGGQVFVMRLNADGTLDTTFNASASAPSKTKGIFVFDPSGLGLGTPSALAVQLDHAIVVAGVAGGSHNGFFSRVKADGSATDYDHNVPGPTQFNAVALSGGKPVLAGSTGFTPNRDIIVGRLTTAGNPDTTFNGAGFQTKDIAGGDDLGNAVALTASGRVVVAGIATVAGKQLPLLLAYTSAGAPDTSFAPPNGFRTVQPGNGREGQFYGLRRAPDGKLVAVGDSFGPALDFHMLAVRTGPTGALDGSFGTGGISRLALANDDIATSEVIQPNGRVVFAGYGTAPGRTDQDVLLGRLKGFPDPSCSVKPVSNRLTKKGSVRLAVKCDQAVSVTARGLLTVKPKSESGEHEVDHFALGPAKKSLAAGAKGVISIKLPQSALNDLSHGAKESATFTIVATNSSGSRTLSTAIAKIKPAKKKH